jgi:hypothetical protein
MLDGTQVLRESCYFTSSRHRPGTIVRYAVCGHDWGVRGRVRECENRADELRRLVRLGEAAYYLGLLADFPLPTGFISSELRLTVNDAFLKAFGLPKSIMAERSLAALPGSIPQFVKPAMRLFEPRP